MMVVTLSFGFGTWLLSQKLADYLKPIQLGVGVKCDSEALGDDSRTYFARNAAFEIILLKVNIKNVFNAVKKDVLSKMLSYNS